MNVTPCGVCSWDELTTPPTNFDELPSFVRLLGRLRTGNMVINPVYRWAMAGERLCGPSLFSPVSIAPHPWGKPRRR